MTHRSRLSAETPCSSVSCTAFQTWYSTCLSHVVVTDPPCAYHTHAYHLSQKKYICTFQHCGSVPRVLPTVPVFKSSNDLGTGLFIFSNSLEGCAIRPGDGSIILMSTT